MKSNLYGFYSKRCVSLLVPILVSLLASSLVTGCAAPQQKMLSGSLLLDNAYRLIAKLQKGGYVIFFRHAKTNPIEKDTDTENLDICESQRNLSTIGRLQAESIGEAFTSMSIPVDRIYASPYCRCMDTAKIAFGEARKSFDLKGIKSTKRHESDRRVNVLINMISSAPRKDKNTVLISHSENIEKATGYSLNEGDAVVVLPMEEKGFKVIAHVTAGNWEDMARSLGMSKRKAK